MKSQVSIFCAFVSFGLHASADSSCWPEEKLVGQTAIGYIEGINYSFKDAGSQYDRSESTKCDVKVYPRPESASSGAIACKEIQCFKGECGDGGDYTSLAVEEKKGNFVKVFLKNRKQVWLKFSNPPEVLSLLPSAKMGKIFPDSTPVLDAPRGKPIKIKSARPLAYTFKKIEKKNDEEWAHVEINPIMSEEPPIEVGKKLAEGYFLFRDRDRKIKAVLSSIWCD